MWVLPGLVLSIMAPVDATWRKTTSEMEGWSSKVSGHKYYAPLRRRDDHLIMRKNRHTRLMHRHRQLLNTTGEALLSVALNTRKHAKQILLEDHGSEFTGPVMIGSPGSFPIFQFFNATFSLMNRNLMMLASMYCLRFVRNVSKTNFYRARAAVHLRHRIFDGLDHVNEV